MPVKPWVWVYLALQICIMEHHLLAAGHHSSDPKESPDNLSLATPNPEQQSKNFGFLTITAISICAKLHAERNMRILPANPLDSIPNLHECRTWGFVSHLSAWMNQAACYWALRLTDEEQPSLRSIKVPERLSCVLQQSWVELLSSPAFHGSVWEKAWRWLCRLRPLHCANSCLAECYTTHSTGHRTCLSWVLLNPVPDHPPESLQWCLEPH